MDTEQWVLVASIFLPIAGAALMMVIPRGDEGFLKLTALVTTLATAACGVYLLVEFDYDRTRALQFVTDKGWIDVINSRYHMFVDWISLPLLVLSMLITLLCVVYSWDHFPEPHNPKAFLILMLVLET